MRRLVLGSLSAGLILLTGACGAGTSGPSADPETTSTPVAPGAEVSEPASSADPTPTEAAVTPATGALITGSGSTVNAPADFRDNPTSTSLGGNVNGKDARYNISLSDSDNIVLDESVDGLARLVRATNGIQPPLKRQPDTTVAGQPAYHLAGDENVGRWADQYGFYAGGHFIEVTISTPLDLPQAERDAIAAPVLASVKLTG